MKKPKKRKPGETIKDKIQELFYETWTRGYNQGKRDALMQAAHVSRQGKKYIPSTGITISQVLSSEQD